MEKKVFNCKRCGIPIINGNYCIDCTNYIEEPGTPPPIPHKSLDLQDIKDFIKKQKKETLVELLK